MLTRIEPNQELRRQQLFPHPFTYLAGWHLVRIARRIYNIGRSAAFIIITPSDPLEVNCLVWPSSTPVSKNFLVLARVNFWLYESADRRPKTAWVEAITTTFAQRVGLSASYVEVILSKLAYVTKNVTEICAKSFTISRPQI